MSIHPAPSDAPLIACSECDLLQHEVALQPHRVALCQRCGAQLYRAGGKDIDVTLALTLSSLLFFAVANTNPLVRLEVQGNSTSATLFGAVRALMAQNMISVAALVFITTILVPALELATMLYILIPIKLNHSVPGVPAMFRFVQAIRPWGMVEVFMLGVLVSVVKLATFANVIPGIALWSFGALMLSLSAGAHFFNPRDIWHRIWLHD